MKNFARVSSFILHPVFIPLLGVGIIFAAFPEIFQFLPYPGERIVLRILINMVLFPVFAMFLLAALGFTRSFQLEDRKQRIIPLILLQFFYIWTWVSFHFDSTTHPIVEVLTMGAALSAVLAFLATVLVHKISLHATGWGLLAGLVLGLIPLSGLNLEWMLILVILLAGIAGSARLMLQKHQEKEIYSGYLVGLFSALAALQMIF